MADIEREDDPINDKPMPLLDHLIELRRRLIWSIAAFFVCFIAAYYFSSEIYFFLAEPLAKVLRQQGTHDPHLIYTQLYEAFFTRIKVAFFGAAFVSFPIVATQMRHWLADADFAGLRGPAAIARLPEAEQQPWRQLWSSVSDLLTKAQAKTMPEAKAH